MDVVYAETRDNDIWIHGYMDSGQKCLCHCPRQVVNARIYASVHNEPIEEADPPRTPVKEVKDRIRMWHRYNEMAGFLVVGDETSTLPCIHIYSIYIVWKLSSHLDLPEMDVAWVPTRARQMRFLVLRRSKGNQLLLGA